LKVLLLSLLFCLYSCSTIRMRHEGQFKTPSGKSGSHSYEKSYDVGSLNVWCWLTGLAYGGACWLYLTYPKDRHINRVRLDATSDLMSEIKSADIEWTDDIVYRVSWDDDIEIKSTKLNNGKSIKYSRPNTDKKSNDSAAGGFLR
jgi:hypothetical protein